jgi:hypothetical protein
VKQQPAPYKFDRQSPENKCQLGKKDKVNKSDVVIIQADIDNRLGQERNDQHYAASDQQTDKKLAKIIPVEPEISQQETESLVRFLVIFSII